MGEFRKGAAGRVAGHLPAVTAHPSLISQQLAPAGSLGLTGVSGQRSTAPKVPGTMLSFLAITGSHT